jgi:hypothetical protein
MIHRDYGLVGLERAITAVEKHIEYYERLSTGSKLPQIRTILQRYRGIAGIARREIEGVSRNDDTLEDLRGIEHQPNIDTTTKKTLGYVQ